MFKATKQSNSIRFQNRLPTTTKALKGQFFKRWDLGQLLKQSPNVNVFFFIYFFFVIFCAILFFSMSGKQVSFTFSHAAFCTPPGNFASVHRFVCACVLLFCREEVGKTVIYYHHSWKSVRKNIKPSPHCHVTFSCWFMGDD